MKGLARKIKQTLWVSPLCLAILITPLASQALTVQEVPNPRQVNGGWVTDMAEILNNQTEAQLNQLISELEAQNGTEIAVVTVPQTVLYDSPKAFTTTLFKHWGIGKPGKNNGILFLISQGERRIEIETGYGIAEILPDAEVAKIIETKITPQFKQGNFDAGTLAGTKALIVVLNDEDTGISWVLYVVIGGIALALAFVITTYLRRRRRVYSPSTRQSYSTGTTYKHYHPKSTSRTRTYNSYNSSSYTSYTSTNCSSDDSNDTSTSSSDFGGGESSGGGASTDYSSNDSNDSSYSSSSSDFGGGESGGGGSGDDW